MGAEGRKRVAARLIFAVALRCNRLYSADQTIGREVLPRPVFSSPGIAIFRS
jgi:hypothetical protein